MPYYKLAFLGFGNVGKALAKLLLEKQMDIEEKTGVTFTVTGIATGSHGIAINPNGIDLLQALELLEAGQPLTSLSTLPSPISTSLDFVQNCGADVLLCGGAGGPIPSCQQKDENAGRCHAHCCDAGIKPVCAVSGNNRHQLGVYHPQDLIDFFNRRGYRAFDGEIHPC